MDTAFFSENISALIERYVEGFAYAYLPEPLVDERLKNYARTCDEGQKLAVAGSAGESVTAKRTWT